MDVYTVTGLALGSVMHLCTHYYHCTQLTHIAERQRKHQEVLESFFYSHVCTKGLWFGYLVVLSVTQVLTWHLARVPELWPVFFIFFWSHSGSGDLYLNSVEFVTNQMWKSLFVQYIIDADHFFGLPRVPQSALNTAVRFYTCSKQFHHITPVLVTLH